MTDIQKRAAEFLVNTPAWEVVMKELLRPHFSDISKAGDKFNKLAETHPAEAYMARLLAVGLLDEFLFSMAQLKAPAESKQSEERFD